MRIKFRLFNFRYYITLKRKYIGAGYLCLEPEQGEDWLRGGDLIDGGWTSFPAMIKDILCREFSVGRFARSKYGNAT